MFKKIFYRLILFTIFLICISGNVAWAQNSTEEEKDILKKVKFIHVLVEESYGEANKVKLPFLGYSRRILDYGGIEVAAEGVKTDDATLHIWAEGSALSLEFREFGLGRKYSGAQIQGKLSMRIGDKTLYTLPFSYKYGPDRIILSTAYATPNDAPFEKAFNYGFLPALFKMLGHMKGLEPLVAALKDKDSTIRRGATPTFWEIKDSRVIKPLIGVVLRDEDPEVRIDASIALSMITGEKFGDPAKWPHPSEWKGWWERNQSKY